MPSYSTFARDTTLDYREIIGNLTPRYDFRAVTESSLSSTSNEESNICSLTPERLADLQQIRQHLDSLLLSFITLAGGAPRDIYMNEFSFNSKPVKDFDFYLYSSTPLFNLGYLENLGFTDLQVLSSEDYGFGNEEVEINWVLECYYRGLKINIITLTQNIGKEKVINNFSCSLSKFELDLADGRIIASKEARLSITSNILIFDPNTNDNYRLKIMNYFRNFKEGTYTDAVMKIVDERVNIFPENYITR